MRQNCVRNASKMRGTPWGEHLLDDTDQREISCHLRECQMAVFKQGGHFNMPQCNLKMRILVLQKAQISFEPGFGAYQGLAQKIKVPFSWIFSFFLRF